MIEGFFETGMLTSLPHDPTEALAALYGEWQKLRQHLQANRRWDATSSPAHDCSVETLSIFAAFCAHKNFTAFKFPSLGANRAANIEQAVAFLDQVGNECRKELQDRYTRGLFSTKAEEYGALFSGVTQYEFSEAEHN